MLTYNHIGIPPLNQFLCSNLEKSKVKVKVVWECKLGQKYVDIDIQVMPGAMIEFKGGRDGRDRVVIREGGVYGER